LKKTLEKKQQKKALQHMMNKQEETMNLLKRRSEQYDINNNLEIAAIKAQLLFLVSRLDRIEQEIVEY